MNKGDKITFGQYPQGENGEVLPLEWRVLDVQGDKALLLTDKLIDYKPYNEQLADVTWEVCTLRQWLNSEFIHKAFSNEQQGQIALVTNQNPNHAKYGTRGGNPTQDKVFALSIDEVKKYFSSDKLMVAHTTDFAHAQGHDFKDRVDVWWLRSPGYHRAADVDLNGGVNDDGFSVDSSSVAVRPALWLKL